MPTINVLFGFDEPEFEHAVENSLKELGYNVESTVKLSKGSIRDFLVANPKYDTAILLEVVSRTNKFTADELALMTDERDINIIPVLNVNLKGTEYMQTLYSAGITSAVFSSKKGATVQDITQLILHKRTRREARDYYGISDKPIELGFLGNDTFTEYYNHLSSEQYGNSLIERFINVCNHMSQKQIADFIRRLPSEVLDELKLYEEFHMIVSLLKEFGIDLHIKRPRKVQIGLVTPENMQLLTDKFATAHAPVTAASDDDDDGSTVIDIKSDSSYSGLSFSELLNHGKAQSEREENLDDEPLDEPTVTASPDNDSKDETDEKEHSDTSPEEISDFTIGTAEKPSKKKKRKKEKRKKKETSGKTTISLPGSNSRKNIVLICCIVIAVTFILLGLYFSGVFDAIRLALIK